MHLFSTQERIQQLALADRDTREQAASDLFTRGTTRIFNRLGDWLQDPEFRSLAAGGLSQPAASGKSPLPRLTTGIAVAPETFERIRAANGSPALADVPPDLDAVEIEMDFHPSLGPPFRLDILTTNAPGGPGAIARYLEKFGEGIQQVEVEVSNVNRATEILRARFHLLPVYPAARPGANGTRINFFLVSLTDGKALVELVEEPKPRT